MRDYLRQYCRAGALIDDVVLCVEEACANAIRHSGSPDDIEITLRFTRTKILATVTDHGRGFDVESFDPQLPPDPGAEHGRGLFIIATLMDSLELRLDGGLEVRMARRGAAHCEPLPLESGLGEPRGSDQLGHREARTRAMLEEIDEGFVALDWEYRYVYANEPACRLLGRSRDELLGRRLLALFPKLRGSELERIFWAAMELGSPAAMEWWSPVIDGWVEVRVYPTPAGVTAYFHDITARKRSETERQRAADDLRESQARFRALFESIQESFYLAEIVGDSDGAPRDFRYLEVNPAFEKLMDHERDRLVGRLASEVVPDLDSAWVAVLAEVADTGEPARYSQYSEVFERQFEILVFRPAARQVGVLVADITERTQAECERERLIAELQERDGELQVQSEELQAQTEELQAQTEELQAQTEKLGVQAESLGERARLAESLNAIEHRVHAALDIEAVLQAALDEAVRALALDAGVIAMREEPAWVIRRQYGLAAEDVGVRLTEQEAPNATGAMTAGEPLAVSDTMAGSATVVGFAGAHDLRSVLAVPLIVRGRVIGCLLLYGRQVRRFDEVETDFGRKLGATVSLAIENARLLEAELAARRGEAERAARLAVLKEIADRAASSLDSRAVASAVVDSVHCLLAARQVQIRLVSDDALLLESAASVDPDGMLERLGALPVDSDTETAVCFRSAARSIGEDVGACLVSDESRQNALDAGVHSYVLVPLVVSGQVVGTFYVAWTRPRRFATEELSFIEAVAAQSATGLENARRFERERRLAAMNAALSAIDRAIHSLLDVAEIVQTALREGAAVLGSETAGLSIHDDEAARFRVAYVHNYPQDRVGILIPDHHDTHGVEAMRTGRTLAVSDTRDDPRVVPELMAAWSIKSVICAPLVVRGRPVAVVYYNYHATAHRFSEQEVDFVTNLASSLSLALENASLYEAQRTIATTLQQNFLHELPVVAGLDLGAVSRPANEPELVGGDFSDVFVVDDRHVVVLIGDVAGKGVRAAGLTETVRSTVRALATIDSSPDFILAKTNELLLRYDSGEPHVTAFLAVLDPHTGHVSYASAGHPAPIHLGAFTCAPLVVAYGPPLGSFERPYASGHTMLTLEDYLVLYTDGVTEARREGDLFGEQRLLEAVSGLRGRSAHEAAAGVRDAAFAFAGRLRDDLQVVVVRLA